MERIIINLKAYKEGFGEKAVEIAKASREVEEKEGISIGISPSCVDIREVAKITSCYSQHAEPYEFGKYTGKLTLGEVKESKCKGTLLNHSENRISKEKIKETIEKAKALGIKVIVCCETLKEIEEIAKLKPDAIAFEVKELIGTKKAISQAFPEEIKKAVEITAKENILLYVGAGIHSKEDVERAISLGAYGILVASSVVKAKDVKKKIEELCSGIKNGLKAKE